MKSCGWIARPASEWDDADIEVLGPGPYTLRLTSVYEEHLEHSRHYVRFRVEAKMKLQAPLIVAGLMAALIGIKQALYLAPLAIPITVMLVRYVRARKQMIAMEPQVALREVAREQFICGKFERLLAQAPAPLDAPDCPRDRLQHVQQAYHGKAVSVKPGRATPDPEFPL